MMGQSAPSANLLMTDLGGVVDIAEGGAAIQRDHNRLEKCVGNLMKFHMDKHQIPHLGRKKSEVPVCAEGHLSGKQLGMKGRGGSGRYRAEFE